MEGLADTGVVECNALYDWEVSGEVFSFRKKRYSWNQASSDIVDSAGNVIGFKQYA